MNDETNVPDPNLEPLPAAEHWPADPGPTVEATVPAPPGDAPPVDAQPGVAPPGGEPASKPSWKTWVAVAATAAVVGAAAVFGISAATSSDSPNAAASTQPGGNAVAPGQGQYFQGPDGQSGPARRPGGFGTIADINGSTLTIEDQSGTSTKVLTSSATTVTTSETGSVDDINVGDTVTVVGTGSTSKIAATRVTDDGDVSESGGAAGRSDRTFQGGPPGGATGQAPNGQRFNGQVPGGDASSSMTRGVVKSVGGGTFTVTGLDGAEVTVTTSSKTTVSVTKAAKVSDLKVGDTVMVQGDETDGTITATNIREGALGGFTGGPRGGPPGAAGQGTSSSDGASQ